jgi:hypothetical protein
MEYDLQRSAHASEHLLPVRVAAQQSRREMQQGLVVLFLCIHHDISAPIKYCNSRTTSRRPHRDAARNGVHPSLFSQMLASSLSCPTDQPEPESHIVQTSMTAYC